jgi:hypothetical protein
MGVRVAQHLKDAQATAGPASMAQTAAGSATICDLFALNQE